MRKRRASAGWLSDDMATALAAMCPQVNVADIKHVADRLTAHAGSPQVVVLDRLLRHDVDRVSLQVVRVALQALYDLRE